MNLKRNFLDDQFQVAANVDGNLLKYTTNDEDAAFSEGTDIVEQRIANEAFIFEKMDDGSLRVQMVFAKSATKAVTIQPNDRYSVLARQGDVIVNHSFTQRSEANNEASRLIETGASGFAFILEPTFEQPRPIESDREVQTPSEVKRWKIILVPATQPTLPAQG